MLQRPPYQKYDLRVRPSRIDGLGVFAAQAIAPARKIGEIRGESISVDDARIRATRSERIMIVEVSPRRAIDFSKSTDPMRYTNHSCRPNCEIAGDEEPDGKVWATVLALTDIKAGDELTYDYGFSLNHAMPCRCGEPSCRGWIVDIEELPALLARQAIEQATPGNSERPTAALAGA